ncbi:DinB family protein [Mangrovicella endophytica]|uniref:DinB family protein n=1 Tax=Mangrovicella endophytica TaxID=2066697 RepID=UPI0018E41FA7|nr:DinB family protein [Mangrovicella endophytica]
MPLAQSARMFAAYNAWCNERLYAAAAELTPEEAWGDRGVFFRSLMGTLNHLLVTDRIWMQRFTGEGTAPVRLDAVLFEQLPELAEARRAEDARIIRWVDGLTAERLGSTFTYMTVTNPRSVTQPLWPALAHLFNHQTHHRGQAHAVLTGFGRAAPSFDLIGFQRESGIGLA